MLHSSRILLLCGLFCAGCSASYKQSTTYSDTTTSYAIYTRVGLPHIAAKPAMIPSDQKHSRTLEWNGHDALCIDMPVDVFYEKAEQPAIEVRGGAFAVDSVHIHNGRLSLSDGKCFFSNNKKLNVIIRGPMVPKMDIRSISSVQLDNVDQEKLELKVHEAAHVQASGRVRQLFVTTSDQAKADLRQLTSEKTWADAAHATKIHLNGRGEVVLHVSDLADVSLAEKPDTLISQIGFSAKIHSNY